MKLSILSSIAASALLTAAAPAASDDFDTKCKNFGQTLSLEQNATVWFTQVVSAGTNLTLPDNNVTCTQPYMMVEADMCRVAMEVGTSTRSQISMEAWLPRNWTGRFSSTGNGGTNGCIAYDDLAYTLKLGFSTVGANNGHNGTTGDAFYNNADTVTDFAWRSVHTGVVVGKEVTKQFYSKEYTKSYYIGCSTGGRQGFKSAQEFPEDFDGIVAGAPAFSYNNLTSWSGHFYTILQAAGEEGTPPQDMWPVIHADTMNQCDEIDGVKDGIIEDPRLCNYRPEALICPSNNTISAGNSSSCLTGAQAQTVRALYSDLYGNNGSLVYPRLQPGYANLGGSEIYMTGKSFEYTDDWYRFAVYNDPSWDPATLGPDDYQFAYEKNAGNSETWNGDLSPFQNRGAKILHYHGQADPIITSENSPRYYDHVAQTMSKSSSELDDFYRFFRISGMSHCSSGPGATFVGQDKASVASYDPEENVLMAMVQWVENGKAPESITGTKFVDDKVANGVDFKRRHCKYPARNVYSGKGDPKSPESWKCVPGF